MTFDRWCHKHRHDIPMSLLFVGFLCGFMVACISMRVWPDLSYALKYEGESQRVWIWARR